MVLGLARRNLPMKTGSACGMRRATSLVVIATANLRVARAHPTIMAAPAVHTSPPPPTTPRPMAVDEFEALKERLRTFMADEIQVEFEGDQDIVLPMIPEHLYLITTGSYTHTPLSKPNSLSSKPRPCPGSSVFLT